MKHCFALLLLTLSAACTPVSPEKEAEPQGVTITGVTWIGVTF